MARVRQPAQPARRRRAVNIDTARAAADTFLARFGSLVDEVVALREALAQAQQENIQLRDELAEAAGLFRDARALVVRADPAGRGRGRAAPGRSARVSTNGRATPASVTADVVRAVIGKLGSATAGEIAAQITGAGTPVSGRAVRHIAKGAGAVMRPGDDGRMVYSLS
jgi:hypothetical protein